MLNFVFFRESEDGFIFLKKNFTAAKFHEKCDNQGGFSGKNLGGHQNLERFRIWQI